VRRSACLCCGKRLDAATGVTGKHKPSAGAATICLDCGHVMVFGEDLRLRNPSEEERADIEKQPAVAEALMAMRMFNEEQRRKRRQ